MPPIPVKKNMMLPHNSGDDTSSSSDHIAVADNDLARNVADVADQDLADAADADNSNPVPQEIHGRRRCVCSRGGAMDVRTRQGKVVWLLIVVFILAVFTMGYSDHCCDECGNACLKLQLYWCQADHFEYCGYACATLQNH
jgi:hypothetical protein